MIEKLNEQFSGYAGKIIIFALLLTTLLIFSPVMEAEEVVAVVRKGTSVIIPVSRYVISNIFGMSQTQWSDGSAIKVFVLPDDNPLNSLFCKHILHIFPHQLRIAWDRKVYSGTGSGPVVLSSTQEMATRLANTPGAIGYLPKESLDDNVAILPVE